jgi:hypothetical protein
MTPDSALAIAACTIAGTAIYFGLAVLVGKLIRKGMEG